MFNWKLLFILTAICIPGILSLTSTMNSIYKTLKHKLPKGFIVISTLQTMVLVIIAGAFGTYANAKINLHAPALEALANGQDFWEALQPQIKPSILIGTGGAVIFLIAYYFIFRPRIDEKTIQCMENLRISVGISGRLFYGGIVEEVLCRWGLMSLFVWLGALLFKGTNSAIIWTAILISGLLFGLGHLPAYLSFGCKKSPWLITTVIGLNLWASIIFGWLFWHYGLCSAIIGHMLFHVIWYPFDTFLYTRLFGMSKK